MVTKRITRIKYKKTRKQYGGADTTIYVKNPTPQADFLDIKYMSGDSALDNYLSKGEKDGFFPMQIDLSFIDYDTNNKTAVDLFADFYKAYQQVCFGTDGKDVKTALSATIPINTIKKLFKSLSGTDKDFTNPVDKFMTMIENIKLIKKHKLPTNNLSQKLANKNTNPGFLKKTLAIFKGADKSFSEIYEFIKKFDFTFTKHILRHELEKKYGNSGITPYPGYTQGYGPGLNPNSGFRPGPNYGLGPYSNMPTNHLYGLRRQIPPSGQPSAPAASKPSALAASNPSTTIRVTPTVAKAAAAAAATFASALSAGKNKKTAEPEAEQPTKSEPETAQKPDEPANKANESKSEPETEQKPDDVRGIVVPEFNMPGGRSRFFRYIWNLGTGG